MKSLTGTGVAIITPFDQEKNVDVEALQNIVEFQIENNIDYIVILGTTAENATLTKSEKELVINTIVKQTNKRIPLVLGIGGNNTTAVVEEFKTTDVSAFEAILSVSPYYNKPTQDGIYEHYKAISSVSTKPIIVYNVPGRTASNILPETIARLANDFSNIVAIKEAKGDIVQAMKMIAETPDDFMVISGDDMITLPMVLAGGSGVISVIAQGLPSEFSKMVNLGLNGNAKEAFKIHHIIAPVIDYIFEEGNPAGIKSVLNYKGYCTPEVRLPLLKASETLQTKIKDFMTSLS
ncbi:4-hydroxy-tetrahydrodipicolinate synthase [Croceibacter atlanticus]|jgi:4-hydroxy-tetrahydrodipicolinate synthase|uniref:4-hydroxy-tetrahydrodipicolinate synthase n=1 Tax=Croceibacter atlanticus TaxID=313588 RepID=UPI0024B984B2|nr:4-hydroxy-tetrahydrodipicolinate synthase [Croceibacter atlanticus]